MLLNAFYVSFILKTPWGCYYYSYFTDEGTEVLRLSTSCLRSHRTPDDGSQFRAMAPSHQNSQLMEKSSETFRENYVSCLDRKWRSAPKHVASQRKAWDSELLLPKTHTIKWLSSKIFLSYRWDTSNYQLILPLGVISQTCTCHLIFILSVSCLIPFRFLHVTSNPYVFFLEFI